MIDSLPLHITQQINVSLPQPSNLFKNQSKSNHLRKPYIPDILCQQLQETELDLNSLYHNIQSASSPNQDALMIASEDSDTNIELLNSMKGKKPLTNIDLSELFSTVLDRTSKPYSISFNPLLYRTDVRRLLIDEFLYSFE